MKSVLAHTLGTFMANSSILKIVCIVCGEVFPRHKHLTDCPYCGGALESNLWYNEEP